MSKSAQKEQAAAHSSSHGENDVGEEGRSGYPLDLETILQKLHVVNSEDRDQTEQMSDSETPYSVSSRTRSKTKSGGRVRHGATEYCDEDMDVKTTMTTSSVQWRKAIARQVVR